MSAGATSYYAVVIVDRWNRTNDIDYSNNEDGSTNRIAVVESATPDLRPTRLALPENSFSGELINVVWDVENDGAGPTTGLVSWYDRLSLGRNRVSQRVQERLLG